VLPGGAAAAPAGHAPSLGLMQAMDQLPALFTAAAAQGFAEAGNRR
jgi:hypothetical protein